LSCPRELLLLRAHLIVLPLVLLVLLLSVSIERPELFVLTLRCVRLAFGPTAGELLTRALDLNAHLPQLPHEVVAHPLHLLDALSAAFVTLVQRGQVALLGAQSLSFLSQGVVQFLKFCVNGREGFEHLDLRLDSHVRIRLLRAKRHRDVPAPSRGARQPKWERDGRSSIT